MATENKVSSFNIDLENLNLRKIAKYTGLSVLLMVFLICFFYLIPLILIALWKD